MKLLTYLSLLVVFLSGCTPSYIKQTRGFIERPSPYQHEQRNISLEHILDSVNTQVNNETFYIRDIHKYNLREYFTFPYDGEGDCEDYAIAKATMLHVKYNIPLHLMEFYIFCPNKSLTMTNGCHAVLKVYDSSTNRSYILDNVVKSVYNANHYIKKYSKYEIYGGHQPVEYFVKEAIRFYRYGIKPEKPINMRTPFSVKK